jgi:hypothetical protein
LPENVERFRPRQQLQHNSRRINREIAQRQSAGRGVAEQEGNAAGNNHEREVSSFHQRLGQVSSTFRADLRSSSFCHLIRKACEAAEDRITKATQNVVALPKLVSIRCHCLVLLATALVALWGWARFDGQLEGNKQEDRRDATKVFKDILLIFLFRSMVSSLTRGS